MYRKQVQWQVWCNLVLDAHYSKNPAEIFLEVKTVKIVTEERINIERKIFLIGKMDVWCRKDADIYLFTWFLNNSVNGIVCVLFKSVIT